MTQYYQQTSYPQNPQAKNQLLGTNLPAPKTPCEINISQILIDFRNTVSSIGAPKEIEQRVEEYIRQVETESNLANPRQATIVTALKTAAKLLDDYISQTLKKQSNVVQDWMDAFLLQEVDYRANPNTNVPASKLIEAQIEKKNGQLPNAIPQNNGSSAINQYQQYQKQSQINKNPNGIPKVVPNTAPQLQQPPIQHNMPNHNATNTQAVADTTSTPEKPARPKPKFKGANGKIYQDKQVIKEIKPQPNKPTPSTQISSNSQQTPNNQISKKDDNKISKNLKIQGFYEKAKNYFKKGDPEKALESFRKTLDYAKKTNDKKAKPYILQGLGESYDALNNLSKAAKCFYKTTQLTDDLGLKATGHNSLGSVYQETGKDDLAMDHYFESLSLNGEVDNPTKQAKTLSNIGKMYTTKYETKEAVEIFKLALVLAKQKEADISAMGEIFNNTGSTFKIMNKPASALKYYEKSIICANRAKDKKTVVSSYKKAAELMQDMGKFLKAKSLYKKAIQEALITKDTKLVKELQNKLESCNA